MSHEAARGDGGGTAIAGGPAAPEASRTHGRRKLESIALETTLRCDQACVFCGSRAGKRASLELTTEEIRGLFRQLVSMGATEVELTGGETYLRDDWVDILRAATEIGLRVAMITAGRTFDAAKARLAKEAGVDRVSVSIDGLEATHNALRGSPDAFACGFCAIASLRAAGVDVGCNTQVNAQNWRELPALAEVLLQQGLYAWQIQLMIPMGRAADASHLWLQPYDMLEVVPTIARVIERCADAKLMVFAGDNVGYFGPHEAELRRFVSKPRHTFGCQAGAGVLGIDHLGNVRGCSALDTVGQTAGSLRDQPLAAIYEGAEILKRNEQAGDVWGFCASCYYASVCRGGCWATSLALSGRPGNNPYCHHRALELAKQGLRERLVPQGQRDGMRGYVAFDIVTEPVPASPGFPISEGRGESTP